MSYLTRARTSHSHRRIFHYSHTETDLTQETDLTGERQHESFDDRWIAVSYCDMKTRLIAILVRLVLGQQEVAVAGSKQEVNYCRVIVQQSNV